MITSDSCSATIVVQSTKDIIIDFRTGLSRANNESLVSDIFPHKAVGLCEDAIGGDCEVNGFANMKKFVDSVFLRFASSDDGIKPAVAQLSYEFATIRLHEAEIYLRMSGAKSLDDLPKRASRKGSDKPEP